MNNRTNQRQVGRLTERVATAVLLLMLAFSAVGAGAVCLYLTPGSVAGGNAVLAIWRAPEVLLTDGGGAAVAGMLRDSGEFVAAGQLYLEEPARYAGELVVGPYELAP